MATEQVYFVRGTCYGCKTQYETVANRYQYQMKCPNPDCVQHVSFSPLDGDPVMDICPFCKEPGDDHNWASGQARCRITVK